MNLLVFFSFFVTLISLGLYLLTADERFFSLASHSLAFFTGIALTEGLA